MWLRVWTTAGSDQHTHRLAATLVGFPVVHGAIKERVVAAFVASVLVECACTAAVEAVHGVAPLGDLFLLDAWGATSLFASALARFVVPSARAFAQRELALGDAAPFFAPCDVV